MFAGVLASPIAVAAWRAYIQQMKPQQVVLREEGKLHQPSLMHPAGDGSVVEPWLPWLQVWVLDARPTAVTGPIDSPVTRDVLRVLATVKSIPLPLASRQREFSVGGWLLSGGEFFGRWMVVQ